MAISEEIAKGFRAFARWIARDSAKSIVTETPRQLKEQDSEIAEILNAKTAIESIKEEWFRTDIAKRKVKELKEKLSHSPSSLTEWFASVYSDWCGAIYDAYINFLIPFKANNFEEAKEQAGHLVNLTIDFTLLIGALDVIATAFSLTLVRNVVHIGKMFLGTLGLHDLMRVTLEPALEPTMVRQLRYGWNEKYPTRIVDVKTAHGWLGRSIIDSEKFKEVARKEGYGEEWDKYFKLDSARPLSYFMLNAIAREGAFDEAKFRFWLANAGYGAFKITDDDIPQELKDAGIQAPNQSAIDFLIEGYRALAQKSEVRGITSVIRKAYREGLIDRSTLEQYYNKIYTDESVRAIALQLADLERQHETINELVRAIRTAYRRDAISYDEAKAYLSELGLSQQEIDDALLVEDFKKLEEPRKLTTTQILRAMSKEIISEQKARDKLKQLGYSEEDIDILIQLYAS